MEYDLKFKKIQIDKLGQNSEAIGTAIFLLHLSEIEQNISLSPSKIDYSIIKKMTCDPYTLKPTVVLNA